MRRRLLAALLLASATAFVLGAGIAAAKFNYFSVQLNPPSPRAGEPFTVTVRLWDDAEHTQPSTWWPAGPLEDLIEFRGDAGIVPVALTPFAAGEYRTEVILPAGDWLLVPFPETDGVVPGDLPAGYPEPLSVTVTSPIDLAPLGIVAVASLSVLALSQVRRRQQHTRRHFASGPT